MSDPVGQHMVTYSCDDVKKIIALYVKDRYGVEVNPATISMYFSSGSGNATIKFDSEPIKPLPKADKTDIEI